MQEAFQEGAAFLRDLARHKESCRLWWLGQSGFLVQWAGNHLLLDPYLSDSLTRKYATTDKPHVRMTRRVIAPEALDFVDIAVSTHNHTDHLDGETLLTLRRRQPRSRADYTGSKQDICRQSPALRHFVAHWLGRW